VLKLRGSAHFRAIYENEIGDDGMRLIGPIHGVRGILAGLAQLTDEAEGAGQKGGGRPR
jgi:hypothetical protein